MVQCNLDDKVSNVIEKYRIKANDFETSLKFIYNAHTLNPSSTVAESCLKDNSNIFVLHFENLRGG